MKGSKFSLMMLIVGGLLPCLAMRAEAACTGSSPTFTSTPDSASVQACINSAKDGDTINVSAGTVTWSSSVGWSGKNINVIGAGIGNTVINLNTLIVIDSSAFRLSGFTFNEGNGDYINISNSAGWRIDHNDLERPNWDICILAYGGFSAGTYFPIEGLIDHNTITFGRVDIQGEDTSRGGRDAWGGPPNLGTVHAIYVEDNNINFPDGSTGGSFGNYVDGNMGCRIVARFNTILGSRREVHGIQGESQDGCQLTEDYNNSMTQPVTPNFRPYFMRGGSGVIFHNTSDGKFIHNGIDIDTDRAEEDSIASQVPNWQFCDGTTKSSYLISPGNIAGGYTTYPTPKSILIDGGGTGGYPCRDQLGRGSNVSLWNYTSPVPSQTLAPVYIWRNTQPSGEIPVFISCETTGANLCTNQTSNIILQNRDYYTYNATFNGTSGVGEGTLAARPATCTAGVAYWATDQGFWNQKTPGTPSGQLYVCTATNTWSLYYIPFTYPHPLQGSGQPPTVPSTPNATVH